MTMNPRLFKGIYEIHIVPRLILKSSVRWLPGNVYIPYIPQTSENLKVYDNGSDHRIEIIFIVQKINTTRYRKMSSFYGWFYEPDDDKIIYINPKFSKFSCIIENISGNEIIIRVNPYYYLTFKSGVTSIGRLYSPQKILQDIITMKLLELNYLPVHCSAVASQNGAIVILAPPDTGKTFTALKLIREGYKFLGEDICYFNNNKEIYGNIYTLTISPKDLYNISNKNISKFAKLKIEMYYKILHKIKPLELILWYVHNPPIFPIYKILNKIVDKTQIKTIVLLGDNYEDVRVLTSKRDKIKYIDKLITLNNAEFQIHDSLLFRSYKYYAGRDIVAELDKKSKEIFLEILNFFNKL